MRLATPALVFLLLHVIMTTSANPVILPIGQKSSRCIPASRVFPKGHICATLFPGVVDISIPNPRSDPGASDETLITNARLEFNNFTLAFQGDTFCSDEIYTLLCFFHYPICAPTVSLTSNSVVNTVVLPCLGVCERVTAADSACTKQLEDTQAKSGIAIFNKKESRGWQYFKNCNLTYDYGEHDKVGTPVFNSDTTTCVEQKHNITMPPSTVKVTKGIDICSEIGSTKGSSCSFRKRFSKSIFNNNDYNYSIECLVKNVTTYKGREAINCTVTESYPINCEESISELNTNILVIGQEAGSSCFNTTGKVKTNTKYLIAGNYIKTDGCVDKWFATRIVSNTDNDGSTTTTKKPMIAPSTTSNKKKLCKASRNSCQDKSRTISC